METAALKNYEELCRLCASYDAIKLPIFSDRGKERKLKDKITTCLPFDVSEDDLLPKSLCYRCIYNLENFYDFRRGCIDARTRLENVIKEVLNNKVDKNIVKLEDPTKDEPHLEDDIIESDGEGDCPNPADFLEACLGESPHHSMRSGEDDEGSFSCKICSRQFNSKSSLTIHTKFHQDLSSGGNDNEKDNYSCFVCDKVFSSKGHLALHSKVHIGETSSPPPGSNSSSKSGPANAKHHRCDLCNKTYSGAKHLWGHVSTAHKGHPLLTCSLCQKTFSSISNLEDHKRCKHKDETSGDQVCISPVIADDESNLEKHSEETSSDLMPSNKRKSSRPRKIERDGTSTDALMNSDSNSQHTHPGSLSDNGEDISNQRSLEENFNQVQKENSIYPCMQCPEEFPEANHLYQHLVEIHGYDGPFLGKNDHNDMDESELVFAESMMESETVFCCEICVREFSDRGSLWLHLLYTHKNAASKACGVCLKICENTESLLKHVELMHPKGCGEGKIEQRRYMCQVCARQHDSRKKLVTHAKIHKLVDADGNLVDPETVVVQNTEFYSDGFIPHPADDNYNSCDVCFKVFENETKLLKHRRTAHRDSAGMMNSTISPGTYNFYFACEICGLSHLSRSERWKHMSTTHAGEPSITCEVPECGKVFPTSSLKNDHAAHHAAQGQYPNTCEVCGKMWKTRVEYWKHMMGVHPDYLPFICGVCLKVFCNLTNLVNHVREIHWPLLGGDFCCDICGRPYSKVSKMTRHRKVHYVPGNPPELQALLDNPKVQGEPHQHFLQQPSSNLICDMCENSTFEFESIEELGKHRTEVHSVMPCDLCTKYYGRTSHLWKHVNKIHKGHPDVTCPTCQRTSASKSHLATHIAKHHRTEETLPVIPRQPKEPGAVHTCEKCNKIFRKETLVNKHIKHCKGPRPAPIPIPPPVNGIYQCNKCDKSFNGRNLLYKHVKHSHACFSCELCDIKLPTRTELYQHICETHADDPNVKCDKCEKILRCKADLDRHRKGHGLTFQLHCCKFCAELVTSKYKLRRHLKAKHGNESKFLCALCLKALPGIKELKAHVEVNHKSNLDRKFTCKVCGKPCQNKSKLLEHMKYHGSIFLPCKICLKLFTNREELDNHLENHPSDSGEEDEQGDDIDPDESVKDTSEISDIKEKDLDDAEGEKRKVSEEEEEEEVEPKARKRSKMELECCECNEIFYSKMALRRHLKSLHNIKQVFNRTSDTKNNTDTPKTEKIQIDGTDSKKLKDESDSSAWETTVDSDKSFMHQLGLMPETKLRSCRVSNDTHEEPPCKCEICGKMWPARKHLWQHLIRYHKNDCGRICGVCLKYCPDYPCLSAHLAVEHPSNFDKDTSGFICRVCGKHHNAKSKLLTHVPIHIGHESRASDTNHHCLICKDVFEKFSDFCKHIKIDHNIVSGVGGNAPETSVESLSNSDENTDLKDVNNSNGLESKLPFHTCDVCSLVFASEIGLTNHKRSHENSDNFKCGQCGEVFQSAENLCTHKLQKHKGTEFVCADCKSNFSTYNQLTEHNKQCKMKIKNMNDNSDDEELLLDDDIEELETSYDVNDTIMSSDSEDLEKSGFPEENDLESEGFLSEVEDEKSDVPEDSQKAPDSINKVLDDNIPEVNEDENIIDDSKLN